MTVEHNQELDKPVAAFNLVVGFVIFAVMTAALSAIAEDVHNNEPLTITDVRFSNWLHTHSTPWLKNTLWVITSLHGSTFVCAVAVPVGIYFWRRRERFWLAVFWLSVYGGWALNKFLKFVFHRARPQFNDTVQTLTTYSFPSGHTMISTVFYGALVMFFLSRHQNWPTRIVAALLALLMIFIVAFSRIYLGAHYLSDVLAAMAEGFAWVALSLTALAYFSNRRI